MAITTPTHRLLQEHARLRPLIEAYPRQAPSLVQTLLDLTHAQRWSHLSVFALPRDRQIDHDVNEGSPESSARLGSALLCGLRPEEKAFEVVWTCSFADALRVEIFQIIFAAMDELKVGESEDGSLMLVPSSSTQQRPSSQTIPPLARNHIILAVHSEDATVVYYKIARGLVKPVN